jgi:hypothetical protein
MASTVNQTLRWTVRSPQDKAGSLPEAVAPAVDELVVLVAQSGVALAQLSWPRTAKGVSSKRNSKNPMH